MKARILVLVIVLSLALVSNVMALHDAPPPKAGINDIQVVFAALVGWPALLLALTSLGKKLGWLPDGSAPTFVYWANLVAFGAVGFLVFTGQLDLLASIDASFSTLAVIIANIAVLFGVFAPASLAANKFLYMHVRGAPFYGYSHTQAIGKAASKKK